MFFAMGISWLAEFTSWLFEWRYGRQEGWVVKARQGYSTAGGHRIAHRKWKETKY